MAMSTKYKGPRTPRALTKFLPFNRGMFFNNHTIQEGFAKVLVNYDLDDAGLSIRPRPGKEYIDQVCRSAKTSGMPLDYEISAFKLGAPHVSGYMYDEARLRDVVLSFGEYRRDGIWNEVSWINNLGADVIFTPAEIEAELKNRPGFYMHSVCGAAEISHGWAVASKDFSDNEITPDPNHPSNYETLDINISGSFITSRDIRNEGLFDLDAEQCSQIIHQPIFTFMNGELYCFMGGSKFGFYYDGDRTISPGRNQYTAPIDMDDYRITLRKLKVSAASNTIYDTTVEITTVPIKQVVTNGFNMLQEKPYTSIHYGIVGGALAIDGVLMYTDNTYDKPVRSPSKEGDTYFRLYATIDPTLTYQIKWEYKNVDTTTWIVKQDWTAVDFKTAGVFDPDKVVSQTFTGAHKTDKFDVRVTLRKTGDANSEVPYVMLPIECNNPELQKIEYQNFDLTTATGMFGYKGSLGLYGVTSAKNTVFMSDVDNPGYFPFPNNILVFDTDVLMVKPFNGNLLVVTLDGMHIIIGGPDPTTMFQKQILSNTYVTPLDAQNIQVLKDQVFFKINNQFYVLKPNARGSDATDLKNYLNSQPIDGFLAEFKENVLKIINDMLQPKLVENNGSKKTNLVFSNLNSGIYDGEVYYSVKVKTQGIELLVHIIYNPITRIWRLSMEDVSGWSDGVLGLIKHLNKSNNEYLIFQPMTYKSWDEITPELGASYYNGFIIRVVNVLRESSEILTDGYQFAGLFNQGDMVVEDGFRLPLDATNARSIEPYLDNYQYLDTGNLMLDDTAFKRFREVQFSVYNTSKEVVPFYSNFFVDGVNKLNPLSYTIVHITDTNDPDYGKIFIEENVNYSGSFPENIEIPEDLDITENTEVQGESNLDFWELDLAAFPDLNTVTVRLKLTGKGRRAGLVLLNTSLKRYELSNLAFVYRNMNAR